MDRVLTESDVQWIVEIFYKSGDLVSNRRRLYLAMGLTKSQLEDIKFTVSMERSKTFGFLALGLARWIYTNRTGATIGKLIEVLQNQEFVSVADKIAEELRGREGIPKIESVHTYDPSSVWFNVPEEVPAFTGRLDEMENLHKSIMNQSGKKIGHHEIRQVTTLSGMGGVGKTTLAIHYAWKYFSNNFYFNVIWINADTTHAIQKSFQELAGNLGLSVIGPNAIPLKLAELAKSIYEYFGRNCCLLVFDNVEQHELVKPYLPIKSPKTTKQYVLITSRNLEWNLNIDLIVLSVFSRKDSVEFLKSYLLLQTDVEFELAKDITRGLHNLPLAIRQAGAYIEKVCLDDYLGAAQVMRLYKELLQMNSKPVSSFKCDSYEKSIYSTSKIALKKIERQNYLAVRIMQIISYFNSESIPVQLLQTIPEKDDSQNNTNINESTILEAVKLLSQYFMVTRDSQFNISVHRLVQKVIREDVERLSRHTILDEAVRTVEIQLKDMGGPEYERNCLLHAITISMHIQSNHLELGYSKFLGFVNSKQNNSIDVHTKRLCVLLEEGKYDEIEESFYKTRNEYFSEPNGEGNILTELFTARFINCLCRRIYAKVKYSSKQGEILKLCELCSKLLVGFTLSFRGSEHLSDFQISANLLKSSREYTYSFGNTHTRSLARTASRMYEILFEYFKNDNNCLGVGAILGGVIECLACLERWTNILEMVESLYELSIFLSKSEYSQFTFFSSVREACDQVCQIIRQMDRQTNHEVQNKLYVATLKIYNTLYTIFRKNENYELTLQSGRGIIECLTHLNMQNDILEVSTDMRLVLDLLKRKGTYYDGNSTRFKDTDLEY